MPAKTLQKVTTTIAFILLLIPLVHESARAELEYPKADRQPIVEKIHGIDVADPYRWMENNDSAALTEWVGAQTSITEGFVAGAQYDASRRRIRELGSFDLAFAGRRREGRLFYMLRPQDGSAVELRVKENDDSHLLLSSSQVPETEFEQSYIGGKSFASSHWPDRAGNMVAYGYTNADSTLSRWRVIDSRSGRHLPDVIKEISGGLASPEWSATGDGFYYFRTRARKIESGSDVRNEPVGLYFHKLGTTQEADTAVIKQAAEDRYLYVPTVTSDGRYLVVQKRLGSEQINSYLVFDTGDLGSEPRAIFDTANARSIYLGNDGTRLFFQTTMDAAKGRVVAVDILKPKATVEVIGETELYMLAGSNVGGDILGYFGGHFVLGYLRDGQAEVRLYDHKGKFTRNLGLPTGSTIYGTLDGVAGRKLVTVSLLNPFAPGHVVSFDVTDGTVTDDLSAEVPFDRSDFVVKRFFYISSDGTRVPMSVMHRKDIELDGNNPAFVYGYGMHKWVSLLFYQAHIIHWMELGGVYAMPAIRGGGEYGDAWHAAGIRANRQNAVNDFVAAGEWLIDAGYTSSSRLAANGGSASGPLAGMIPLRYGDVFAAATVDYPVADLVRAPLYGNGALLTEEYGSLEDPLEAKAMLAQSPYHHAGRNACHIPTLVMVGENDKVVLPFHGYKYTAALQATQQCEQPVLLNMMKGTGHNYGLSPEQFAANTAVQITFLRRVLGF